LPKCRKEEDGYQNKKKTMRSGKYANIHIKENDNIPQKTFVSVPKVLEQESDDNLLYDNSYDIFFPNIPGKSYPSFIPSYCEKMS
jgi:hypothetical protein